MIGKKAKNKGGDGTHFYECLEYNAREKNKAGEDKCEWVEYRNLNSNDHVMAAHEMMMTAEERRANAEEPLFHYIISWDSSDDPAKEQMLEVADRWLEHMGMDNLQVQIASHVDTQKPHIHLAVNRVDPENHNSWPTWKYKTRSETLLKELEREYGWKEVPGKLHPQLGIDIDRPAPKAWEIHREQRLNKQAASIGLEPDDIDGRGILQKCGDMKDELYRVLDNKEGFRALDEVLDKKGLWIEARGQGAVISDGQYYRKASDLDGRGQFSGPKLEEAFGESLNAYTRRREESMNRDEGIRLAVNWKKALDRKEQRAVEQLLASRMPRMEKRLQLLEDTDREYRKVIAKLNKCISGEMELAYNNPPMARKRFQQFLKDIDPANHFEKAQEAIIETPELFGEVNDEQALTSISIALREGQQAQGEFGRYFSSIDKQAREEDIARLKAKLAEKRSQLGNIKSRLARKAKQQIAESEAGEGLLNTYNKSLSVYRATRAIQGFFVKERLVGRSEPLDRAMGSALKDINDSIDRAYDNPLEVKQFFSEISWNDYHDREQGINHIEELFENPEKYGEVKDQGEIKYLKGALERPAEVREEFSGFLAELGDIGAKDKESGKTVWDGQWFKLTESESLKVNFGKYAESEKNLEYILNNNDRFVKDIKKQPLPEPVKDIISMRKEGKSIDEIFAKHSDFLRRQGGAKEAIEYFKRLPDAYNTNDKLVGGLSVARELNRWVGRAASGTPAGRAIFKLGGVAMKLSASLGRMIAKPTKTVREGIRAVIKDSVSITKVQSLEHHRSTENEREDFSR
jgi:hypothetical protein